MRGARGAERRGKQKVSWEVTEPAGLRKGGCRRVRCCPPRSVRRQQFLERSVESIEGALVGRCRANSSWGIKAFGSVASLVGAVSFAGAPVSRAQDQVAAAEPSVSQSVGRPTGGRLIGGVALQNSDTLSVKRGSHHTHHGTAEIVRLIEQGATDVAAAFPDSMLLVGDLSRPSGRRLRPHRSHQNGLDADIGFFLLDEDGQSVAVERFVSLRRNGCGEHRGTEFCLDAARTWQLLASLVSNDAAAVQYVLINPALRELLIAAGVEAGASEEVLERARTVTEPHSGSREHRSHMHLRIYCPPDDRPDCRDQAPFHAWYVGQQPPRERVATRRGGASRGPRVRRQQRRARARRADRAQRRRAIRRQAARMAQRAAARRARMRRQAALRRRRAAARQGS